MQSDSSSDSTRPPLTLASKDPKAITALEVDDGDGDEYNAELFVASAENHLIAGLLCSTADEAAAILRLIEDTDLENFIAGAVVTIIRTLLSEHPRPELTPQAVIARARRVRDVEHASFSRLADYIMKAYTMGTPISARCDAAQVVEDAYLRSHAEFGTRIKQMADSFATVEDLKQLRRTANDGWDAMESRILALRARTSSLS
ncbi:hypothetical protein ACFWPX_30030 [Nocardia sp. NPDC058518]|uniref:hypothetical protein n=1 Tax=Nocardia sp. NPDC058518 TaxID=3346534 RepID=UPI0036643B3B